MMIPIYQIDAFTDRVLAGNPAAVCPLESWPGDDRMQAIASENNLSETAFFVPENGDYRLRWFTPNTEVDLCGHATLASAYVIFSRLAPERDQVRFQTLSGPLDVTREGGLIVMDFPARPALPREPDPALAAALGAPPDELLVSGQQYMAVFADEATVRGLAPDMGHLATIDRKGVMVTAPGSDHDFVSRYFAPKVGIPEDPVTGSAHCTLTPYWAARLGRDDLRARQISARGGDVFCRLMGDRVRLAGHAAFYMEGTIHLP